MNLPFKMPNLRKFSWRRLALELAIVVLVVVAVDQWRSRDLLSSATPAPVSQLPTLQGEVATLPAQGPGLVYFFAPWCTVCHLSIGNLVSLSEHQPDLTIQIVALDYQSREEVEAFIAEQQLPFQVLLGNQQTFSDWAVRGYPTYYLIDQAGNIQSQSMGYSTELGLWVRSVL